MRTAPDPSRARRRTVLLAALTVACTVGPDGGITTTVFSDPLVVEVDGDGVVDGDFEGFIRSPSPDGTATDLVDLDLIDGADHDTDQGRQEGESAAINASVDDTLTSGESFRFYQQFVIETTGDDAEFDDNALTLDERVDFSFVDVGADPITLDDGNDCSIRINSTLNQIDAPQGTGGRSGRDGASAPSRSRGAVCPPTPGGDTTPNGIGGSRRPWRNGAQGRTGGAGHSQRKVREAKAVHTTRTPPRTATSSQ